MLFLTWIFHKTPVQIWKQGVELYDNEEVQAHHEAIPTKQQNRLPS